ncbi:hypothetical protein [Nocardioides sp. SYSU D00038]|nr:hypothetical protein [Nocardioides sp. SYSU D00038]
MNFIISAVVGGLVAAATFVAGVQAFQGADQKPVSETKLYAYSDQ